MNKRSTPPAATSLPLAPQDEAAARMKRYAITMGIRTACFLLMAFVQPFGWWTWVFGAGAIFLPYVAVVFANTVEATDRPVVDSPQRAMPASPAPAGPAETAHGVIRISETPPAPRPARDTDAPEGDAPESQR